MSRLLPRGDWKGYDPDAAGEYREFRSKTFGTVMRSPSRNHKYYLAVPKLENAEQQRFKTAREAVTECENAIKRVPGSADFRLEFRGKPA